MNSFCTAAPVAMTNEDKRTNKAITIQTCQLCSRKQGRPNRPEPRPDLLTVNVNDIFLLGAAGRRSTARRRGITWRRSATWWRRCTASFWRSALVRVGSLADLHELLLEVL